MSFNWTDLIRQFCGRSFASRTTFKSLRSSRSKPQARRLRPRDVWPSVEPMEVRVVMSGTPTLTVVLSSDTMSELSAGNGVPATVQRTDADLSQALTVELYSSDTTEASVPTTVTIAAGASSANFLVLPVDDRLLDGPQSLQITAAAPGYVYSSVAPTGPAGLDTTFGTGGYSSTPLAWSLSSVLPDMLIQPDGAIVSLSQTPGSSSSWSLSRKTASGADDTSFGNAGLVTTTFSNVTSVAPNALARQSDGKILAVGFVDGGTTIWSDLTVVRYNTNGTLDTTFGTSGILRLERTTHTRIHGVTTLADGSIILSGAEGTGSFLAKLTSSGALDSSFGTGGIVLTNVPGTEYAHLRSVFVQSDGQILAAGSAIMNSTGGVGFIAMRFNSNGTLDTTFDSDGMQQIDTNVTAAASGLARSAALQPDGKLVIVGYSVVNNTTNDNWAIVRLDANGALDTTFSGDGRLLIDFNGLSEYANDVVVQPDGKLLVMGSAFVSGNGRDPAVVRLNTDGTLDTTFDGDGKLVLPNWPQTIWEQIWAGQLNSSGQLVFLAGYSSDMRVGRINLNTPAPARDTLTVTDWESLVVSITPTSVAENAGPAAISATVTRSNLDDLSADLVVSLASNDTTELEVPASVLILAGQSSASFNIDVIDDSLIDGTQSVRITPSASGYFSFYDTLSVTDNDANAIPVVTSQDLSVNEDNPLSGVVSGTDADGNPLTYSVYATPTHGQVTMDADGAFTYTPAANFAGADTFQFRAFDGKAYSAAGTVNIDVNAVNDAPVANPDSFSVDEDGVLVTAPAAQLVTRIQMVSDPGDYIGQGRTYDLSPSSGAITASASNNRSFVSVSYQNPTNTVDYWLFRFESTGANIPLAVGTYNGATRYPFNDEGTPGLSVTGQGRGSNALTGSFTIHAISFDPAGALQSLSISFEQHSEGTTPALRGTIEYNYSPTGPGGVLSNDTDIDGNSLSALLVTGPAHGSVSLNSDGSFSYTPEANYNGADSFTYKANDGALDSNVTTVSLTVNPVDDTPDVPDQSFAIDENSVSGTVVGTVAASDADAGQTLTYAISDTSLPGAFAINAQTGEITVADGSLLDHEQVSTVSLVVTVTDSGNPARSSSGGVTVAVGDINEAPVIAPQSFAVKRNSKAGAVVGTVVSSDPDVGQTRTYAIVSGNGTSSRPVFAINATTGVITVKTAQGVKSIREYNLGIRVTDNGSPALSTVGSVRIYVNSTGIVPASAMQIAGASTTSSTNGSAPKKSVDDSSEGIAKSIAFTTTTSSTTPVDEDLSPGQSKKLQDRLRDR